MIQGPEDEKEKEKIPDIIGHSLGVGHHKITAFFPEDLNENSNNAENSNSGNGNI